jgi:hypothetical protein
VYRTASFSDDNNLSSQVAEVVRKHNLKAMLRDWIPVKAQVPQREGPLEAPEDEGENEVPLW